jgi:Ran GTPase-activating protein (RanGAP) involved in mRNA processing and transport
MLNELRRLRLNGNDIGPNAVWELCEALKARECKLEVLQLENNPISPDGARYLGEALRANDSLLWLSLSFKDIQEEGLRHISDMLVVNQSLKV